MTYISLHKATAITGWMALSELRWLAERAQAARVIVEIGSWKGRSTRALGDHTPGVVYAVDHWQGQLRDASAGPSLEVARRGGEAVFAEFRHNLTDLIAVGRVEPIRMEAQAAFPVVRERLARTVDLVFIDGDHSYEGCKANIAAYRTLIRPGGILAGHDYNRVARHAGVRKSVDEAFGVSGRVRHVTHIWWVQL